MINKILAKFGYELIKVDRLSAIEALLAKSVKDREALFKEPKVNPPISYNEFYESNGRMINGRYAWNVYWKKWYEPHYQAFYLRKLSNYPHLIKPFLLAFAEFDWVGTAEYMKSVNWCWSDNTVTPTIDDLQDTVLGLLESCISEGDFESGESVSSGGFEVSVSKKDEEWSVKITFDKTVNQD